MILDQLAQDIKSAMKSKEKEKLSALRYLKSMLMENKTSSKPIDEQEVVIRHFKKLQDSLSLYSDEDVKKQEIEVELSFLKAYMPEQLSEDDVKELINKIISSGATNMGAVMKELSPQIKGKFNGKQANELVKQALN